MSFDHNDLLKQSMSLDKKLGMQDTKRVKETVRTGQVVPIAHNLKPVVENDPFSGNENNRRVAEDCLTKAALVEGTQPPAVEQPKTAEQIEAEKEAAANADLANAIRSSTEAPPAAIVAPVWVVPKK